MATLTRNRKRAFYSSKTLANYRKHALFDGVNDYIDIPPAGTVVGLSDWSISFELKHSIVSSTSQYFLTRGLAELATTGRWAAGVNSGKLRFVWTPNEAVVTPVLIDTTKTISDNLWHRTNVLIDRDGVLAIYIDGVLDKQQSIASSSGINATHESLFRIGCYTNAAGNLLFYTGRLDNIKLHKRLLTPQEIASGVYDNANLVGEWLLNSNANDSSGNNYHGTAYNGLTFAQEPI